MTLSPTVVAALPSLAEASRAVGFALAVVFAALGAVLNSATLYALISCTSVRQQTTTRFVISLAAADLVYCAVALPATAIMFDSGSNFGRIDLLCRLVAFVFSWNFSVMMLNHAAVAFSRYVTVCLPPDSFFQSRSYCNWLIIVATWLLPFACLSLPLASAWGELGLNPATATCTLVDGDHGPSNRIVYLSSAFLLPASILAFCYFRIYSTFMQSSVRIKTSTTTPLNPTSVAATGTNGAEMVEQLRRCSNKIVRLAPNHVVLPSLQTASTQIESRIDFSSSGEKSPMSDDGPATPSSPDPPELQPERGGEHPSREPQLQQPMQPQPQQQRPSSDRGGGNYAFYACWTKTEVSGGESPDKQWDKRRFSEAVLLGIKERTERRERNEKRMTATVVVIFVAFVVCTLPPIAILILDPDARLLPSWHVPLYAFGWAFGAINPLIYVAFNQSYRQAFKDAFARVKAKVATG